MVTFGGINEEHNCYVIPRRPVFRPPRSGGLHRAVYGDLRIPRLALVSVSWPWRPGSAGNGRGRASFDVLEAGEMVEGRPFDLGFGSVWCWFENRLAALPICRLLLRLLRFCAYRWCRLCDPPTHCVSLVRECSDWG